jgi:hypothetical protein
MGDPLQRLIMNSVAEMTVNTALLFFILGHLVNSGAMSAEDIAHLLEDQALHQPDPHIAAIFRERLAQWREACEASSGRPALRLVSDRGQACD